MNKKLYNFILQFITCKERDCKGCLVIEADIVAIDKACRVELTKELIKMIDVSIKESERFPDMIMFSDRILVYKSIKEKLESELK